MTIKEIDKQVEATKDAREKLAKTQRDNEAQAKEYRAKADAAAIAGDMAAYKEFKTMAEDAEDVAYVCKKQMEVEQGSPVTLEQTQAAWADYAADFNKKLAAKLRKFEAAKAEMLKEYAEAVELQRDALVVRERMAGYVNKMPAVIEGESWLAGLYPMEYIHCTRGMEYPMVTIGGSTMKDADAVYYLASFKLNGAQLYEDARQKMVTAVVYNHRVN